MGWCTDSGVASSTILKVSIAVMLLLDGALFLFAPPVLLHSNDPGSQWTEHTTDGGRTFYFNRRTRASQWHKPFELFGWRAYQDYKSGRTYYHNAKSGETVWDLPDEFLSAEQKEEREEQQKAPSAPEPAPSLQAATVELPAPPGVDMSVGWLGTYYHGTIPGAEENKEGQRIDEVIDFEWSHTGCGVGNLGTSHYSVRWSGYLTPERDGLYTFYGRTNDGHRLWVENELILSYWHDQNGSEEFTAVKELKGGVGVPVVFEYYQATLGARVHLRWRAPGETAEPLGARVMKPANLAPPSPSDN
eukprot:TRINITY_DN2434_c0_g5_i1.p1 TRINITY_DN2434_c0_g5~~TRINITY_DN2434_c0_g5_i1.p1  ORF type:complete len:303 (+),score=67.82 TRINITY_DN2434_c0_g5_i1:39-947(+)